MGLGLGLAMTLAGDAVVSAAPPDKAGSVAAVSETGNELGVALGIAVLGSLITAVYRDGLTLPPGVSDEVAARASDAVGSALAAAGPASEVAEAARTAFVTAMQTAAVVTAALTLLAAVVAWLTLVRAPEPGADPAVEEDPDGTHRRPLAGRNP